MVVDFASEKKKRLGAIYAICFDPTVNVDEMTDLDWALLAHPDGTVEINRFALKFHIEQIHGIPLKDIIFWDINDNA